jgi:hypothetical protein
MRHFPKRRRILAEHTRDGVGLTIGGYQVIKKWLSYREKPLLGLGRGLTPEEVRYVTEIARRLAALITLQSCLDDNYREMIKTTYQWTNQ